MDNNYYQLTGVSGSQYPAYVQPDPLERELISSYDEAMKKGCDTLKKLSLNELRTLNENPDRLSAFLKESLVTQPMIATMINCREKVKTEADANLKFGPDLDEARENVQQKYEELQELESSYKDGNKVYQQLCQKFSPQNIAQGLLDSVGKNKNKKTFEDLTNEEKAEFLAKKARQMEQRKEKQRLRYQIRAKRRKQLSEERKMKLFEEKLERLELRKTNPEAYHDLMAEERKTVWREKLAMKQKQKKVDQERLQLKMNDPEAYNKLLNKEREAIRKRITDAANTKNPVNFSNKIEIIAKDPEKGGKYKVVLKKVFPRKQDVKEDVISQLVSDKSRPIEIVQNVVKEIDFSKTKRVKFAEADKLTKISNQRSMEIPKIPRPKAPSHSKVTERIDAATSTADGPAVVVEPMITFDDFSEEPLQNVTDDHQDGHQDDHHLDDDHFDDNADPFEGISDNENFLEDATDGYDHCYTNKTLQPNEDTVSKDPFEELRDQLRSLPESEARALVRDKMDAYKETFKKQMTRIRAIIQAKKKVDRKVKMLTRTLCLSLREQYVKYYKN